MTNLVDHLYRQPVVDLGGVGHRVDGHRHRAGRRDLGGERDDRQEQLLPFQPAFLDLAEHVAADGAVHGAVHAVVLLLLHREVRPHDLLQRVLLGGGFLEGVVGSESSGRGGGEGGLPGQLGDLRMGFRQALPAQSAPPLRGSRRVCRPAWTGATSIQPCDPGNKRLTVRRVTNLSGCGRRKKRARRADPQENVLVTGCYPAGE